MRIVFVEVELLSNLRIREVETHEVQTQNPDAKRLMMTGKDGVGQIVKAPLTGFTQIALSLRSRVIASLFGNLWTVAMGTLYAIRTSACRGR